MADDGDVFKKEFKRYRKPKEEDFKCIIDCSAPDQYDGVIGKCSDVTSVYIGGCNVREDHDRSQHVESLGLKPLHQWNVYELKSVPGLLIIPNPFMSGYQHYWIYQSLVKYPCHPNITNLDGHLTRPGSGQIWPTEHDCLSGASLLNKDSLLYKLRWVTLGYHYDWNSKLYYQDHRSPFPASLSQLTMFILRRLGFTSFIPEAAIVNYYHLDSTLSGHTDHSEEDLSAPLISISFGQSAIFLIGGQSKQVKPVPLLIRSGDVVIMSGASRLCYHGVPKIISPTGLQQVIPDCLEKIHLERLVGNCKGEPARCLMCVNDDGILSDSNIITTTNTDVVSIGSKRIRNEEDSNQITKLIKTDQLMVDSSICNNCHWLWINWEHFQSYLSYSRININVRQVGDITMKDK